MLQYMGHASVIWRIRLKPDREDIVLVVSCNVQILSSSSVMLKLKSCKLQLWDMLRPLESEAMKLITGFGILIQVCYSGV